MSRLSTLWRQGDRLDRGRPDHLPGLWRVGLGAPAMSVHVRRIVPGPARPRPSAPRPRRVEYPIVPPAEPGHDPLAHLDLTTRSWPPRKPTLVHRPGTADHRLVR